MSDPSLQANTTTDEIAELQRRLAELENQLAVSRQAHHVVTDMVDRIDDTFFAVDREWRYLYVNPAAARVACMNPADLLGKTMWETFPQLLGSIHEQSYRQAMAEQIPVHFEAPGLTTGRWCEFSCYPSPDGLSIQAREISARKQAEREREAWARQQAVVAALGQRALSRIDLHTFLQETIEQVAATLNVAYAKLLERMPDGQSLLLRAGVGWKPAYMVGQTTIGAEFDSQSGYTLISDGPVVVSDLRTETRFGSSSLLLDHGVVSGMSVVIGGRQRPYGVMGVYTAQARLFTQNEVDFLQSVANVLAHAIDRKQVEDKVREVAGRLGAVVITAVDGILTIDEGGVIESANPAVETIFGYKPSELIGCNIKQLMPEPYHSEHDAYLANYLRTGEAKIIGSRREVEGRRKDGSVFPLELAVSEITLEGRRLFTGIVRDITERKQAEQALRESEAKFRAIFTRAISGIVLVDERNTYTDINPAICQILGASRADLLEQPARFYPPGVEMIQQEIQKQLQQEGHWHGEFPLLNMKGELLELEWWVSDLVDPPLRVAIINDITERKSQERRMAAEHAISRILASTQSFEEAVPVIVEEIREALDAHVGSFWRLDEESTRLRCNFIRWQGNEELLQQFASESQQYTFARGAGLPGQVWDTEEPAWIVDVTQEPTYLRGAVASTADLISGAAFPIISTGEFLGVIELYWMQPRQPDQGLMKTMSVIGNEIGQFIQRWQAETALRASEEFTQQILQSSDDCITVLDLEGRLQWMNEGGQKLLEIGEIDKYLGTPWFNFSQQGAECGAAQRTLQEAVAGGTYPFTGYRPTETGKPKWWDTVVTSIKDAYGHPDRLLSVSRDITEHQQAEEERERLLAALAQERERLKALTDTLEERVLARTEQVRALAAKVSLAEHEERKRISQILHDYVQQMLYGIQMRMYLMASDIAEKNLESLQIHFQEMKQLIEEAVQAVRTLSVELSPPSLRDEGLAEAMTWLAERMKELHGLQVAIDVHGDCQVADSSLRMVLFQIVQELLFNVVKHAETDQAFVTLRREGEKLTVTVRDEGKGFETAVSSRKDPRTGLGLSSIRERLALFGGDLDVASAAGKGTRIRIDLPLH